MRPTSTFVPIEQAAPSNPRFEDLSGKVFGDLTVISFVGIHKKHPRWRCKCSCGATTYPTSQSLKDGRSSGCGHRRIEATRAAKVTHGEGWGSVEYVAWLHMRARCLNPNDKSYPNYGGRGISICDRWLDGDGIRGGFECFLADMGRRPSSQHSIDRYPDNNGNYEPGNCRWAEQASQQRNRRDTIVVLVSGVGMALADACDTLGLDYRLVRSRMQRGWSFERAASEPKHWRGA